MNSEAKAKPKQSILQFWKSLSTQRRLLVFCLTLSDLLAYVGISVISPFFPKEANDRGVSNTVSGIIFGIYAITKTISCPIFGKLLPHVGSRFMYLSGMFISAWCTILFGACAFLPTGDGGVIFATFCMLVRITLALGMAAYVTASFTIIALEYHEQLSFVFSIAQAGVGIGFILGPSIGGVLYEIGGFIFPFIILGAIQMAMFCVNYFIIPRRPEYSMNGGHGDASTTSSSTPIFSLLSIPLMLFIMLGVTTVGMMFGSLDASLEPGLRPYGVDTLTASFCFLIMALTYTFTSPLVGWLCQSFAAPSLELFGIIGMASSDLVLCASPILSFSPEFFSLPLTFVMLGLIGFFGAFVLVPSFEWMKRTAVQRGFEDSVPLSSAIGGLWNSANALGDFMGPTIAGVLLDVIGFRWGITIIVAFSVPLMIGLIVGLVVTRLLHKDKTLASSSSSPSDEVLMSRSSNRYDKHSSTFSEPARLEDGDDGNDSTPLLGGSRKSSFRAPNFRWQTLSI